MVLIKTVDVRNGETVVGSVMNLLLILDNYIFQGNILFLVVSWFWFGMKYENKKNLQVMND